MRGGALLVSVVVAACATSRPVDLPPAPSLVPSPETKPETKAETSIEPKTEAPIERAPPPPRRPGAYANLDPDDDLVVGPPDAIDDCDAELRKAGVKFQRATLAVHEQKKSHIVCGAPQVVTYLRGPGDIAYSAPPLLTCTMALALASVEKIVQDEAQAALKSRVVRIDHMGTYNCREMAAYKGWVSEHAYANAIDVVSFVLKDGRTITVLNDFDTGDADPPKKPAATFLRRISRRANDEDVFSHVLTPFFDALHKNHFHLDLARYRSDGTRPQG